MLGIERKGTTTDVCAMAPDDDSDLDLLRSVAERADKDAFRKLFSRHLKTSINLATRIAGDVQSAEDAVQEAMLRVWRHASTFSLNTEGNVRGWILRIVARESARLARKRGSRKSEVHSDPGSAASRGPSPADAAERGDEVLALRRCLDELPFQSRQLVALHFGAGLTHREIGDLLSISRRRVSYRIREILEELRGSLTRAGVAAVVPLLEPDGLQEAACGGSVTAEGLIERVMPELERASLRAAQGTSAAPASVWVGGLLVAAVTLSGVVWALLRESEPIVTAPEPAQPDEPAGPLSMRWTFEKGLPDWELLEGKWGTWRPPKGDRPACAIASETKKDAIRAVLPVKAKSKVLLLTARVFYPTEYAKTGRLRSGTGFYFDRRGSKAIMLSRHEYELQVNTRKYRNRLAERTFQIRAYCVGRYIVDFYELSRHDFFLREKSQIRIEDGKFVLVSVHKYSEPFPADQYQYQLHGLGLEELTLREISDSELPPLLRDIDRLFARLAKGIKGWKELVETSDPSAAAEQKQMHPQIRDADSVP